MQEIFQTVMATQNLFMLAPELLLAVGAMVLLLYGAFISERSHAQITGLAIALIAAAIYVLYVSPERGTAMNGAFILDDFAWYMKLLTLLGSGIAIIMSVNFMKRAGVTNFEFPILVVTATIGMLIMISANNLITLYLGLELQSLSLYVLAALNRDSVRSTEAGLKYFVLGALSSGMLLYGASLIYGFTGTVEFAGIAEALAGTPRSLGLVFGLVFLLAGIAFKISAVPFHMWTPDVYEGSMSPIAAFFAAAPKIAAMSMLIRIVISAFEPITTDWQQILVFIAIASMALGAFAAIGQTNIKRLMAYSSIGHMGYALVGLAAGTQQGVSGVILYMTIYMVMTIGTFACIIAMRGKDGVAENIHDLAGLAQRKPLFALALTILMFSLAGIPPMAGFFAKYFVFVAAIESGLYALAIIGVLTSVVGAFYYLRIIKIMWFDEAAEPFVPMPSELRAVLALSSLFIVFYVVFAGFVSDMTAVAAASFF